MTLAEKIRFVITTKRCSTIREVAEAINQYNISIGGHSFNKIEYFMPIVAGEFRLIRKHPNIYNFSIHYKDSEGYYEALYDGAVYNDKQIGSFKKADIKFLKVTLRHHENHLVMLQYRKQSAQGSAAIKMLDYLISIDTSAISSIELLLEKMLREEAA
jgi:hypothetical protein